jgi:hypothetical protein
MSNSDPGDVKKDQRLLWLERQVWKGDQDCASVMRCERTLPM